MNELLIVARAVHFGSCLALLAVFAVRLLVERPAAGDGRAGRGLAAFCLGVAAVSGFLWLWVAAAGMSGSGLMEALNPQLFQMVLEETPPGQVWIVRGIVAVMLGVVLCFPRGGWRWGAGGALAAVLAGSLAWLGHAGAGEDGRRSLMLVADVAHLLAAGVWPAGLLPFALLVRRLVKGGAPAAAYAGVRRFSAIILATVGVLAASGLVNAFFLVGSFRALVSTDYGRLLMVKVVLFGIAAAFGAWNLLVHKPRLETAPAALAGIARKVWIELALGTLIVLVVAIMGTLPPAGRP